MYGTTLIDQKLKAQLAETLSKEMKDEVKIWMFTDKSKEKCEHCDTVEGLMRELCSTSKKLSLYAYDINDHQKEAKVLGIERVPAILLHGVAAYGIYYYGMPTGYEFNSLIEDIIDVSNSKSRLSKISKDALQGIMSRQAVPSIFDRLTLFHTFHHHLVIFTTYLFIYLCI